jgi:hypothetical protein
VITFEQARAIVAAKGSPHYPPEADFQVATWGWENSTHYQLVSGSYANVYGLRNEADEEFFYLGDSNCSTVDKLTGEYTEHGGLGADGLPFELPDAVPVGTARDEFVCIAQDIPVRD